MYLGGMKFTHLQTELFCFRQMRKFCNGETSCFDSDKCGMLIFNSMGVSEQSVNNGYMLSGIQEFCK